MALLALEHAPDHALELVRSALRWEVPLIRTDMIAILEGIDQPWCARELHAGPAENKRFITGGYRSTIAKRLASRAGRLRRKLPPTFGEDPA
jgi:hypothetical protein